MPPENLTSMPHSLPPAGSTIVVEEDFDGTSLTFTRQRRRLSKNPVVVFLGLWMIAWSIGVVFAIFGLVLRLENANGNPPIQIRNFLLMWLAAWMIGGAFIGTLFWKLVRRGRPERIVLGRHHFLHDPGSFDSSLLFSPEAMFNPLLQMEQYRELFSKRKPIEVPKSALGPFRLMRVGERQRLTFDHGADRHEIGRSLREPEREWLAARLMEWHPLPASGVMNEGDV